MTREQKCCDQKKEIETKEWSKREKDPEKNVVVNDDLASKAKGKEEHDNGYCSDNRLIREIQEQMDIQWFESGPTKEMMVTRGGLVLTKFLDRFRVLKKDHEDKLKGVNSGRKESEIEAVDDIRNTQKNVRSEDKWPRRWNSRVGTEWEDFKAEWSDYVASEGLSGLNEFERKYTLLYALGCYDAQTWMLNLDTDNEYSDWKMVMEKLDEFFLLRENRSISKEKRISDSLTLVKRKDV